MRKAFFSIEKNKNNALHAIIIRQKIILQNNLHFAYNFTNKSTNEASVMGCTVWK